MQLLDNITAEKPQLSQLEITLLSLSVAAAGSGPIFFVDGYKVAEVLAPACAACKFWIVGLWIVGLWIVDWSV